MLVSDVREDGPNRSAMMAAAAVPKKPRRSWLMESDMPRYLAAALAACSMNRATTNGCERNGTWLDLTSVTVAPMRFA
jgi:hypothetical protein